MFPLTDSLLRFRMADELVLYILPCFQGEGSRLFAGSPDPSAWELAGTRCFRGGGCLPSALQAGSGRMTILLPDCP